MYVTLMDELLILTRFYLLIAMIRGADRYILYELKEHSTFPCPSGLV